MKPKKCLVTYCQNNGAIRGLCLNHYNAARNFVRYSNVTWDDLEKRGKSRPPAFKSKKETRFEKWLKE